MAILIALLMSRITIWRWENWWNCFHTATYWKDMAIFVTEDDAQDGHDHVDAHRSLLLVISPYARRGVSHVHTSMVGILENF